MATIPLEQIGSYTQVTGEQLLQKIGVTLSKRELNAQLELPQSFYADLLHLISTNMQAKLLLQQAKNISEENEERLINLNLLDYLNRIQLSHSQKAELAKIQNETLEDSQKMYQATKEIQGTLEKIYVHFSEKVREWKNMHSKTTDNVYNILKDADFNLSDHFKEHLQRQLELRAAGVTLSEGLKKQLDITGEPDPTERAVIAALMQEEL